MSFDSGQIVFAALLGESDEELFSSSQAQPGTSSGFVETSNAGSYAHSEISEAEPNGYSPITERFLKRRSTGIAGVSRDFS
jgi:hypothetical protein